MTSILRPALVIFTLLTLITGVLYPLVITGIAAAVFPRQAAGSLITSADGRVLGSSLIGQEFSDPKYFWGRLSATGPAPYTSFNADKSTGSSGSNLAPTNPAVVTNAQARIDALNAADTSAGYARPGGQPIPVDLVTSSASGLDPHISPAAAEYQLPRIAKVRGMSVESVRALVQLHTRDRTLGLLGEPVVNFLNLNLALDSIKK